MAGTRAQRRLERVTTGVPGLDEVLGGGLIAQGMHLVIGPPGTGKTILASQIVFHHVAEGGRGLYITLLAETHGRLIASLEQLRFFRPEALASTVSFISGYGALVSGGLDELLALVRRCAKRYEATLAVIDGVASVGAAARDELALKRFFHGLQVVVELTGTTMLLLMTSPRCGSSPKRSGSAFA